MKTTFDDWLRQLAATGRANPARSVTIDRGLPFTWPLALAGDWSSATLASSLRSDPDAGGAPVASLSASAGSYDENAGLTTFELSLTAGETNALPADDDGDALVMLALDVLITPAGSAQQRLFAIKAIVAGKVTDAS